MRILHVLNELRPSGAETMLRAAAASWRQHGFTGEILSTGEVAGAYADALRLAGYRIHHLPFAKSWRFLVEFFLGSVPSLKKFCGPEAIKYFSYI